MRMLYKTLQDVIRCARQWSTPRERVPCYELLTYLPHPNPCIALGSRLDHQWSPLHDYRPYRYPPASLGK